MSTQTFKIALIGAGGISGAHVGAVKASEGRLANAAVADPNPENRAKVASQTAALAFPDANQLFDALAAKKFDAHAVLLCTPPSARLEIVERALSMNLPVLAEKPIAHNLPDALKLADLAAKSRVLAAVGYCHRFTPAVLEIQRLVRAGKIGKLTRFENTFATFFPALKDRWMSDPAVSGGGSFIDTGCHSLDLFHFLVGTPWIESVVKDYAWPNRGESSASALVRAAANNSEYPGVAGVILSGWMEPDRFTVKLVGAAGALDYDYLKPTDLLFTSIDGKSESIAVESHEVRFLKQLLAFADAVQHNRKSQLATFADALATAHAIDAANRMAK